MCKCGYDYLYVWKCIEGSRVFLVEGLKIYVRVKGVDAMMVVE